MDCLPASSHPRACQQHPSETPRTPVRSTGIGSWSIENDTSPSAASTAEQDEEELPSSVREEDPAYDPSHPVYHHYLNLPLRSLSNSYTFHSPTSGLTQTVPASPFEREHTPTNTFLRTQDPERWLRSVWGEDGCRRGGEVERLVEGVEVAEWNKGRERMRGSLQRERRREEDAFNESRNRKRDITSSSSHSFNNPFIDSFPPSPNRPQSPSQPLQSSSKSTLIRSLSPASYASIPSSATSTSGLSTALDIAAERMMDYYSPSARYTVGLGKGLEGSILRGRVRWRTEVESYFSSGRQETGSSSSRVIGVSGNDGERTIGSRKKGKKRRFLGSREYEGWERKMYGEMKDVRRDFLESDETSYGTAVDSGSVRGSENEGRDREEGEEDRDRDGGGDRAIARARGGSGRGRKSGCGFDRNRLSSSEMEQEDYHERDRRHNQHYDGGGEDDSLRGMADMKSVNPAPRSGDWNSRDGAVPGLNAVEVVVGDADVRVPDGKVDATHGRTMAKVIAELCWVWISNCVMWISFSRWTNLSFRMGICTFTHRHIGFSSTRQDQRKQEESDYQQRWRMGLLRCALWILIGMGIVVICYAGWQVMILISDC